MNLYELIKQNGEDKGKDVMWNAVCTISEYLEDHKEELDDLTELYKAVYSSMSGDHYNRKFADDEIRDMYYIDKSGVKHNAPYWTKDEIANVWLNVQNLIPGAYNECDFDVALNMIKSDYYNLVESWFPDDTDKRLIDMTVTYLNDPDSEYANCKIWHQYND